jgi:hypothetical protein
MLRQILAEDRWGNPRLSRSQWWVRSGPVVGLIVALLAVWAILAVLGLAIKGLIRLFVVGLILFVVTGIFGRLCRA